MPYISDGGLYKKVTWAEIVAAVAKAAGYTEVDLEPMVGSYKVTAKGNGAPATEVGQTAEEACERLCRRLW